MLALLALTAVAADPDPATIPPPIRAMLDAAIAANDEAAVRAITKYARAADPASADATLKVADDWRTARAEARDERLRTASVFELWTGRIEAGGSATTGNSNVRGVTLKGELVRESLYWRHKLNGTVDYQRSAGITSREYYLGAYQANWKLDDRLYLYGTGQFESDRFFGFSQRYGASVGAGYAVIRSPAATLNLEVGPAFRYTDFTDGRLQRSAAARGNVDFDWNLSSGIKFSQDAAAYVEQFNNTISATSALAAKLVGPLSGQVSYSIQYESAPPDGRVSLDTISRASLVYSF